VKKLLIFLSIFAIAACSSKPKEEEPAPEPVMTESPAETPEPTPAPSEDSMTMDKGENMEGGFPDVEGTERSGATCKNGSDERMVSVIDTREGPCGVVYTKHGNKKTVAYAKFDMGFCDKVFDNIVSNLTSGGFDCGGAGKTASAPAEEEPAQEEASEESAQESAE
jgi:hypothetical protein